MTAPELESALRNFTGSEQWHKWSALFPRDLLTDGVKFLADEAHCYWLMDAVASHQHDPKVKAEDFQVWVLKWKGEDERGFLLTAEDGNGNQIARQVIHYSDFPLSSIKLYACRNELGGRTIMLPSEW